MKYKRPGITVDIIIRYEEGIVLIKRKNPPHGWALPGGFVDYGETLEDAAVREAKEETNLNIYDLKQLHAYSDPSRDPRGHTITVAFSARGQGKLKAADDTKDVRVFAYDNLPKLVFDHKRIIDDYRKG